MFYLKGVNLIAYEHCFVDQTWEEQFASSRRNIINLEMLILLRQLRAFEYDEISL